MGWFASLVVTILTIIIIIAAAAAVVVAVVVETNCTDEIVSSVVQLTLVPLFVRNGIHFFRKRFSGEVMAMIGLNAFLSSLQH